VKGTAGTVPQNRSDRLRPRGGFVKGDIARHLKELVMGNAGSTQPLLAWTRRVMDLGMKLMQLILGALRNTDRPIMVYVWHAWFIVCIPSILIGAIVLLIFGSRLPPGHTLLPSLMTSTWFGVRLVVVAWTETLVMWPILFLLRRILGNIFWVPVVSGSIWGGIHALGGERWGVSQIWGFFVLSVCFLEWEKKSKGLAILVTGLVHMCINLVIFLSLFLLWIFFYS